MSPKPNNPSPNIPVTAIIKTHEMSVVNLDR